MNKYLIDSSTLSNIADSIREKNSKISSLTPLEMPQAILDIKSGGDVPTGTAKIVTEGLHDVTNYAEANVEIDLFNHITYEDNADPDDWERPVEWGLMANGYDSGEQLYMVYDTELLPQNSVQFASWYCTTSAGNIKIERGYVDSEGVFNSVSEDVWTKSTTWTEDLPSIGHRYLVYKFTPISGHIKTIIHDRPSASYNADITGQNDYVKLCQPMIEAYGNLPYVTSFYSSATRTWGNYYLIHQDIKNLKSLTSCAYIFNNARNIECIGGLDTADTSNVTSFASFMSNCFNLTHVDLKHIKVTSKCTSMSSMFTNCAKIKYINASDWDTSNVTLMTSVFNGCLQLQKVDCSSFVGTKVTRMESMFYNCNKIREVDLSNFNTPSLVANTSYTLTNMFNGCYSVQRIDISKLDTRNIMNMSAMFQNCWSLRELKLGENFKTDNVTNMSGMFYNCMILEKIDTTENWNTSKVTTFANMFRQCSRLKSLDLSNFSTTLATTCSYMFGNCYNLESVILPKTFVTSKVTTIGDMFTNCLKLNNLDVTDWDTSNVTTMSNLFQYCRSLTDYGDVSNWTFDKVTTIANMFAFCDKLKNIPDFSGVTFTSCTTASGVFQYCIAVDSVNMSGVSFPKATTLANLFYNCYSIKSLSLTNWNVPLVTTLSYAFGGLQQCSNLVVNGWTAPKLNNMTYIFYNDYALKNVDCTLNFSVATSANNSFTGCYSLTNISNFMTIGKAATTLNTSTLLTVESLVKIFEALPTLTTSVKLTVGTVNLSKLSDSQKALATSKGWTLG